MEELVTTSILSNTSCTDKLHSLLHVDLGISVEVSSSSSLTINETISLNVISYCVSTDKRRFISDSSTNFVLYNSSIDKLVFKRIYSTFSSHNTSPLTNLVHRVLYSYSFVHDKYYATPELMLINTTQTILNDLTDVKFFSLFRYKSEGITFIPTTVVLAYSSYDKKLRLSGHSSATINLLNTSQLITYDNSSKNSLCFISAVSSNLVLLSSIQSVLASYDNFKLFYANNHMTKLDLPNLAFTIAYYSDEISSIKFSSYAGIIDTQKTAQVILFGGDNTFYSIKGFFNYFRYKYPSLMPIDYYILIDNKRINMYNLNMQCIESHKAGYKKVSVLETFLTDKDGLWCDRSNLPLIVYENKIDLFYSGKIYTYNFDTISFTSKNYLLADYSLEPKLPVLFYDTVYGMPYVCSNSTEVSQDITEPNEYWNFIQINNIKKLVDLDSFDDGTYEHEVFTPTEYMISSILFINNDKFILQGYKGTVTKAILLLDKTNGNTSITELLSYNGSDAIYALYPYVYFSRLETEFTSSSDYSSIVKLDLSLMDFSVITVKHSKCIMDFNNNVWMLYYDTTNSAYYLIREDQPAKKINITILLNIVGIDIIDFKIFNNDLAYFITSDKKVYELNYATMLKKQLNLVGTPIILIKFNQSIGCVLTRKDTYMFFEELQQIDWTTNSSNWISPQDMKKGELLFRYSLASSILHKRSSPIKTIGDFTVAERTSLSLVEKEIGIVSKHTTLYSQESLMPIRVGICSQTVHSEIDISNINPKLDLVATMEYNESLKLNTTLNLDGTFKVEIQQPEFPEILEKGFDVYVR